MSKQSKASAKGKSKASAKGGVEGVEEPAKVGRPKQETTMDRLIAFRIPKDLSDKLDKYLDGRQVGYVVRKALEEFLNKNPVNPTK